MVYIQVGALMLGSEVSKILTDRPMGTIVDSTSPIIAVERHSSISSRVAPKGGFRQAVGP